MPSRPVSILAIGLNPDLCELVETSARASWPAVEIVAFASVEDALGRSSRHETEILVLASHVAASERLRASSAVARDGLSRWPVVVFAEGTPTDGVWFVAPRPRDTAEIAQVFAQAAAHHAAVRAAGRARGDLWTIARRISHEMRSPLGCILTSADVIREEFADLVPSAGALAQPIIDSAHEMMALIERLTLVARASAMPFAPGPVDMGMIVWAARERLAVLVNETKATIHEPDEWPPAVGQAEWLECIWKNLLENALRHAGPQVQIELGWNPGKDETVFFVRDHGGGVAAEIVPLLLRPFHQLHLHDSGRGLGLAIVQRLVELHGGRCGYEAVKPRGSRFFFTLPAG